MIKSDRLVNLFVLIYIWLIDINNCLTKKKNRRCALSILQYSGLESM